MFAVSVTLATTTITARRAHADPPPREHEDVARAEARFHAGERLFDDKQYAAACAAFDESQRLDPQLGTLLNLAFCQEMVGKTATAWREYDEGAVWAEQRGQHERAAWALARAFEVSKRLPLVLLDMPGSAAEYEIEIDGGAVPKSDWATPLLLDPGEHVLQVSAAGRLSQQLVVRVPEGPATQNVTVAALAAAPPVTGDAPLPEPPRGNGQLVVGLIGLGLGVGSLGVGTYYGALTLSKKSDASAHCMGTECDATGVALQDDAHRYATVSTLAFAVGVVSLGVGAWLTWTAASSSGSPTVRATIQPLVGPRIAGVGMGGTW